VYSPRLRRDQIKALFYLKRFERRPMTRLAQEAVDRFLDEHGGVEGLTRARAGGVRRSRRGGAAAARRALTASATGRRRRASRPAAGASVVVVAVVDVSAEVPGSLPAEGGPELIPGRA
jgi:hypothetical protein